MKDRAYLPLNGVIFDGDYYKSIPYSKYIKDEALPSGKIFDIKDYGAYPSETELMTDKIQRALLDAGEHGGTVYVHGGRFLTGTLTIPSHVHLFIERDSALVGSKDPAMYKEALIKVFKAEDVKISGGGTIYGNGEYFVHLPKERPLLEPLGYTKLQTPPIDSMGYPEGTTRHAYRMRIRYAEDKYNEGKENIPRPFYNLWIRGSKHVEITNIVLQDAADWTLVFDYSEDSSAHDLVIDNNRHVANTDGIDIMGSERIEIYHAFISTADDGICIKAPMEEGHDSITIDDDGLGMRGTRDISIRDCTVVSVMNAFKIGTETYFDIENISVENCHFMLPDIYPGGVSGISIESADGSRIKNVRIHGITMESIMAPIFICLCKRCKFGFLSDEDRVKKENGGTIEDIVIENIKAMNAEVPSIITGFKNNGYEGRVKNISIRDFECTYLNNKAELNIIEPVYENVDEYPESNAFGDVPAYGIFARHVDNLSLVEINIKGRENEQREKIVLDDVSV